MRKYSKLLLATTTLVSLACLIFYKTQYDKLYNVLQVLDLFGSPGGDGSQPSPALCPLHGDSALHRQPAWTQVAGQQLWLYSAFCTSSGAGVQEDGPCAKVTALGVALSSKQTELENVRCKLWYEGGQQPVEAITAVVFENSNMFTNDAGVQPVRVHCESKYTTKVPYGAVLVMGKEETFIPVSDPTGPSWSSPLPPPKPGSVALCVLPTASLADSTYASLENLLVHSFFGVKSFFFYDRGLTNAFLRTASEAMRKDPLLHVHLVPWNPPQGLSADLTEYLLREDCFLRTSGLYDSVGAIKTSQILVPVKLNSVVEVLHKYREAPGALLQVDVLAFCSELPSEAESSKNIYSLTCLEQTSYDKSSSSPAGFSLTHFQSRSAAGAAEPVRVEAAELALHDYGPCNTFEFSEAQVAKDISVFSRRESIQERIGQFFPHKSV